MSSITDWATRFGQLDDLSPISMLNVRKSEADMQAVNDGVFAKV